MSEQEKTLQDYREQAKTLLDYDLDEYYVHEEALRLEKENILTRFKNGEKSNEYVYVTERFQLDHKVAEQYIKVYSLDVPTITTTKPDWKLEHQIKSVLDQNNLTVPDQRISGYFRKRSEKHDE